MVKILDEILKELPKDKISSVEFEAANIVVYTTSRDFLFSGRTLIRSLVSKFKKRIELRAENTILLSVEETEEKIKEILKDVEIGGFKFDSSRSLVIVEVDNVGTAVGKAGANLKEIQKQTFWSVEIRRTPPLRSKTVDAMRAVEFQESEFRRKFLNKVGRRIYGGWSRGKIKGWARVTMLGAGNQIGRSAIYLQTSESRILFDCGIDPAKPFGDSEVFPLLDSPDFKLEDVDAIVLSHAHMDHCGLLPYLYKSGYKGPIYCTEPTRDLMALSQLDFIKIMNSNPGVTPIYKAEDVREMIKHVIPLNYNEVTDIAPDIRLTFYNSGHILGSAFCHINIGNGMHNFLYTGDFNYSGKQRLFNRAETVFPRLESMMMENTNTGPKDYAMPREEAEEEFLKIILDTYVNSGKVLIPVFGIGRAQDMLLTIEHLIREERLPENLKVYFDGMVGEVNAIHTAYPEFLRHDLKMRILKGDNPFLLENFKSVDSKQQREEIMASKEPCVVIATSGMMNGGSSVEYFKNFAPDEKNAIIFVGYQAQGTLGRRVKDGEKEILLSNSGSQDDKIKVNMKVHTMHGAFSGHSDVGMTKKFLADLSVKPKLLILNHGDKSKISSFSETAKKIISGVKVYTPENLDSIRLV
jgi:hypothetical protein